MHYFLLVLYDLKYKIYVKTPKTCEFKSAGGRLITIFILKLTHTGLIQKLTVLYRSSEIQSRSKMTIQVVAELCCNHMGSMDTAKKMITQAKKSNATYAKFQKWSPEIALSKSHYNAPHPNPQNSFGEPYGKHRENLEFTIEQHLELKLFCEEIGINYATSVFDHVSAKQVVKLKPDYIKIPSQKNLKIDMYDVICSEFEGDIHISSGMTTDDQVDLLLNEISKRTDLKRVVLYATTSNYPCNYEDLHLLRISDYISKYSADIKCVGFSGHHNGIAADAAAVALGAKFVERHFTLDRTWKGTDHAASLEPQGLSKLVRDVNLVESALTHRPNEILGVETDAFKKVKSSDAEAFNAG